MSFYGIKPRNPNENIRFSKVSQTGLGVFSSEGGIKPANTVNTKINQIWFVKKNFTL